MRYQKRMITMTLCCMMTLSFIGCENTDVVQQYKEKEISTESREENVTASNATDDNSGQKQTGHQDDAQRFAQYCDDLFFEEICESTIDLHYTIAYPENYGIDEYEVALGNYEETDAQEVKEELLEMQERLKTFSRDMLTDEQKIAYDIMADYAENGLATEDLYYYGDIFSPLTGLHTQLPVLMAEYTFRCEKDVADYLTLLSQMDETFSSYFVYEKEKAEAGLGVADFSLDDTIEACEEFVENPEECYLIETFDERIDALDGISADKKEEYKKKNKEFILHDVMDAYRNLAKNLETLKGQGKNDKGLCKYKDGKRYYEYLVRSNVGSDMAIADIKDVAETFIEMRRAAIYDLIADDPDVYDLYFDETPLSNYEPDEIMEELIQKCERDFGDLPDVPYEIKYVPKAMEEHLNPAFYLTPPIDDPDDNVIYINRKYEDSEDLFPLLAHEGYPGHLYQIVSSASYDKPLIRNLFSFSGYTEGYATYAELYSYTLADVNKNYAKMMQYDNSITLAVSAYIDVCVNYYGWDENDVYKYLKDVGMGDRETAQSVFRMVVEEPAEYLEYYVGFLEFMNLRNEAKEQLGNRFDLKAFHKFLISVGPAPFYLLEDYMQEWIKEQ